ncbi:FAD-binding oxidoreductase [Tropicibacter sp. Alg240-R139]|uniref:FAD-binding oxidoreductase n=1 Tax=Tropicibacter sp. Alg240-R139 TaxID=2305991 RepID=UPI0013DF61B9|nr:FAD-binding oxidoreductase [Tropicibacter sp. Alg240-R139]
MTNLKDLFAAIVGADHVLTADRLSARDPGYCTDALGASVLVRPANSAELSRICKNARAHRLGLVPHGGLTGLVNGTASHPGEAIVSFERMSQILHIDALQGVAVVEPGVTLEQLQAALEPMGLMIGVDIPSRGSCTNGGMVSTNAGGIQVLRYGMMRQNVLGLEVVLADGRILDLTNVLIKNNAGYDLKQIFIGSEGTLGLVTKIVVKLWPVPAGTCCALVACQSSDDLPGLFDHARSSFGADLMSFEAMWPEYYQLTTSQPGFDRLPLPWGHGVYAIVEVCGTSRSDIEARLAAFIEPKIETGTVVDAVIAQSEAERRTIWRSREDSDSIDRVSDTSLSYDVGLQLADLSSFAKRLGERCAIQIPGLVPYVFGHVGDGNLHIMFAISESEFAQREIYDRLIYDTLSEFSASTISAEHGIGLEKRPFLVESVPPDTVAAMGELKQLLDPFNTFNPGKVLATVSVGPS